MTFTTRLLLLLSISLFAQTAFSQGLVYEKRHYISVYGQLANPLGDFASTPYPPNFSPLGGAKMGLGYGIEGAYFLTRKLGLAATWGRNSFDFDGEGLGTAWANQSLEKYNYGSGTARIEHGKWKQEYFLAGPIFSLPFYAFSLDVKVLAGLLSSATPSFTSQIVTSQNKTLVQKLDETAATGLGYQLSLGLRYAVKKNWGIKASVQYLGGKNSYDLKVFERNDVFVPTVNKSTIDQSLGQISFSLGVVYTLAKKVERPASDLPAGGTNSSDELSPAEPVK